MTFGVESAIPNAAPYTVIVSARRGDRMSGESLPFLDAGAAAAWIDKWVTARRGEGFEVVRAEIHDTRNGSLLAGTAELAPPISGDP